MRRKAFFIFLLLTVLCLGYECTIGYYVYLRYVDDSQPSDVLNVSSYRPNEKGVSDGDLIRHRFDLRRQHVKQLCSRDLYRKNTTLKFNLIVVDEYKLMYCSVPKTGCTNWKRLFLVLRGRYNSTDDIEQSKAHQRFKTLADVTEAEAEKILKTYTKLFFLREPFGRIVSAYRNKFEDNSHNAMAFRKPFVSSIMKMYRENNTVDETLMKGNLSVTFQEFVQYLGDNRNSLSGLPEEHWRETYRLCSPCEIDYDYIGHFDTLFEDSKFILKALNIAIDFPVSTNPTNSSHEYILQEYYKQINLTEIERIKRRYRVDLLLYDSA
ncbi:carbohydrate sulfotransferase 11-like [Anneissia japonica]|uniref:carbohydrate sulfotransferase 11-like n=1 Tax=Anneissia japonica TaxID=1529436 RepID=UPI0014257B69|nr:carbohydrate sulfotransferase 11-like [Anneissia japonica]